MGFMFSKCMYKFNLDWLINNKYFDDKDENMFGFVIWELSDFCDWVSIYLIR